MGNKYHPQKKFMILILAVLLISVIAVGGTLAFLTDTQTVNNTFVVGDIEIDLDEPNYPNPEPPVIGHGDSYPKDPTVTGVTGDSYMRITVEFVENDPESQSYGQRITDTDRIARIWQTLYHDPDGNFTLGGSEKYESTDLTDVPHFNAVDFTWDEDRSSDGMNYYVYNSIFSTGDSATLFTSVIVPDEWEYDELSVLGKYSVVIQAEAIQAHGFADADEAFAALDLEIANGTVYTKPIPSAAPEVSE